MLNVFIGYDPRQPVAFHVAAHSVLARTTVPVAITPLTLGALPIKRRGLTEFTFSRFLVPYLSDYKGYSVFIDSDIIVLHDISELAATAMLSEVKDGVPASVFVVKNKLRYEWPSMMVYNNEHCQMLTPAYIDDERNPLFDFAWAERVGDLPAEWNQLVGYDEPNPKAKLVHYTQGIPVWPETKDCEYSEQWRGEFKNMASTVSFAALMGNSVHAKAVYERLNSCAISGGVSLLKA